MISSLLENTSKAGLKPAKLVLEDGLVLEGYSCGAEGEVFGEVCFNTSLEGYLEVISDPSYAGQSGRSSIRRTCSSWLDRT